MVIFVFLVFAAMFAVAGFFLSLEAKRRSDGQPTRRLTPRNNTPKMGRASSGGEREESTRARAA
jgi:hypothetical protein